MPRSTSAAATVFFRYFSPFRYPLVRMSSPGYVAIGGARPSPNDGVSRKAGLEMNIPGASAGMPYATGCVTSNFMRRTDPGQANSNSNCSNRKRVHSSSICAVHDL